MGIFNAMVEALVIFKILFDLMLEIGTLICRAVVALFRMIVSAIKHMADSDRSDPQPTVEPVSVETETDE